MKIGLSGTGRIGRLCLRKALAKACAWEIGLINTTASIETLAHLLQYDSIHGKWDADIQVDGDRLIVNGHPIPVVSLPDPDSIPWGQYGIELVIDATGKFANRSGMEKHLSSGARKVLVTSPSDDADLTIVLGVNEHLYDPIRHHLLSAASCTTNCLAPVLFILDQAFGVKYGWMTTVHAFTSDQKHLDNNHKDLRRARACTSSIIPTSTGISKALTKVLPSLAPHMKGISLRVPTQDVSLLDLQVGLNKPATVEEVQKAFKLAVAGRLGAYVDYNELPLVSTDYIGNEKSAVIDGLSIMSQQDQVKVLAWYDNEWAYASRVTDIVSMVAEKEDH
ncbi:type I glyceraldehyde-3-phosphate dehydrogenase [Paenibacillus montanisoli]|uniref:Glyceraldehyde-3-phosphate dehydrogenase n=1 Tax=Paenibacillus montanisoli TaxID=2081970 RepID=A0A328U5E8_9BACL|nr:type I glyceraldehyde-3-phosphate dehydrogenase [Paenibacillus montanisoli]RAP75254.1 type I glyceraldehyde-3-phosphate dehydrogenase [Paenibacillus montanisoli]